MMMFIYYSKIYQNLSKYHSAMSARSDSAVGLSAASLAIMEMTRSWSSVE
jgi:hypothetical protein